MSVVASSSTLATAICGQFIYGMGLAWLVPNLFALVALLPERERSIGFGLTKGCFYAATVVGVVVLEPISGAFGASGVLMVASTFSLLVIGYIMINRTAFSDHTQKQSVNAAT